MNKKQQFICEIKKVSLVPQNNTFHDAPGRYTFSAIQIYISVYFRFTDIHLSID